MDSTVISGGSWERVQPRSGDLGSMSGVSFRPRRVTPELLESTPSKRVKTEPDSPPESQAGPSARSAGSDISVASFLSRTSAWSTRSAPKSVRNPQLDDEIHKLSQIEADRLQAVFLAETARKEAERSVTVAEEAVEVARANLEEMVKEKKVAEKSLKRARREKEKVVELKEERAELARRMREIDEVVKRRRN